jgi:carboxyl-terminal processing protease
MLYAGPEQAGPDIGLFERVFERVRDDYVRQIDDVVLLAAATDAIDDATPPSGNAGGDWLVEMAIRGMLESLDPYSSYLPRDQYKAIQDSMRGEFGGLGIQITKVEGGDGVDVVTPLDGTPAFRAGIKPGDRITHIDRVNIAKWSLGEVVGRLRGPVGKPVSLTIRRNGSRILEVSIKRAVIRIAAVTWRLEGEFGYLRITGFTDDTAEQVEAAVAEIRTHLGGRLAGLVIDLRNNPGGLLIESVAVSDAFIDSGDIVVTRGRNRTQRYSARNGDIIGGLPIVVLINGASASAAEILAGALKDHDRAILIGARTFGKGTVQTVIPMGHGTALKLTTARYYTPSGKSVDGGIVPDVEVAVNRDSEADEVLERGLVELRRLAGI